MGDRAEGLAAKPSRTYPTTRSAPGTGHLPCSVTLSWRKSVPLLHIKARETASPCPGRHASTFESSALAGAANAGTRVPLRMRGEDGYDPRSGGSCFRASRACSAADYRPVLSPLGWNDRALLCASSTGTPAQGHWGRALASTFVGSVLPLGYILWFKPQTSRNNGRLAQLVSA